MSEYNANQLSVNEDSISREQAIEKVKAYKIFAPTDGVEKTLNAVIEAIAHSIAGLPAADVEEVVRCKDCKHFEYNHPYIIQGIPVLGHEVCNAWGNGCKTDENGYCFMAERRTDE